MPADADFARLAGEYAAAVAAHDAAEGRDAAAPTPAAWLDASVLLCRRQGLWLLLHAFAPAAPGASRSHAAGDAPDSSGETPCEHS